MNYGYHSNRNFLRRTMRKFERGALRSKIDARKAGLLRATAACRELRSKLKVGHPLRRFL